MRNLLCILPILFLVSCSTPEYRAKKMIREDFKTTLNDYKSYEPVNYSVFDTLYTTLKNNSAYKTASFNLLSAKTDLDFSKKELRSRKLLTYLYSKKEVQEAEEQVKIDENRVNQCEKVVDSIKTCFQPQLVGVYLSHSFRARIPAGGYKLFNYEFLFDEDVTVILDKCDTEEKHLKDKY